MRPVPIAESGYARSYNFWWKIRISRRKIFNSIFVTIFFISAELWWFSSFFIKKNDNFSTVVNSKKRCYIRKKSSTFIVPYQESNSVGTPREVTIFYHFNPLFSECCNAWYSSIPSLTQVQITLKANKCIPSKLPLIMYGDGQQINIHSLIVLFDADMVIHTHSSGVPSM